MKTTRKQYIREQKTICGDSYAEVDFCWITEQEHRAGRTEEELLGRIRTLTSDLSGNE